MTHTLLLLLSTLALALAACGDGPKVTDAGPPVDAPSGPPRAVVVGGDFEPGNPGALSTLDMTTQMVEINVGPALAVGDDPILRHFGNELLVVNRSDGNNITILDDQSLALKAQLGTGASANPQDVAVVDDRLYAATFNGKGLVMMTRGTTTVVEIDLSRDDPDGRPNCNSVYRVGNDVYVSCGLLADANQLAPRGPGKVYVVDTATNTIRTTLTLSSRNPFGLFEQIPATAPHGGDLLIPTVLFNFDQPDDGVGCIERITPGANPVAHGCLIDNTEIGGYASRFAFQADASIALLWVVTPRGFTTSELRGYDMASKSFWPGGVNPSTQQLGDIVICPSGEAVVTDRADPGGLRIYNGSEVTRAMLPVGFVPRSSHGLACY